MRSIVRIAALFVASVSLVAADLKVMTSGAFTEAYMQLLPQLEKQTGQKIVTTATTMGAGPTLIPFRLQNGEVADVVIVSDSALQDMIRDGLVLPGSRVPLVRSEMGMAVRAGAPKPDISTVGGLKRALLQAKSIAYSASVSGNYLSTELFQSMGIADQVLPKSKKIENERVGTIVARGDAEIGFQQKSELLPVPGIDYVGPLPPEVQRVTIFSAGIAKSSPQPDAARALIKLLTGPGVAPVIEKTGLDPIPAN